MRGTPSFRAHALPSDPCRTGGKKGHGRQAGQAAGRQTKDTFAKSRLWPVRRGYLARFHLPGFHVFTFSGFHVRPGFHVFTFSRLENWVNVVPLTFSRSSRETFFFLCTSTLEYKVKAPLNGRVLWKGLPRVL